MKKLRIGIIGAGRIGKVHARTVSHDLSAIAVAITDINHAAAEEVARIYGITRVAEDSKQIFSSSDIDAVLICSSTNTHAELMVQAAKDGH